MATKLSTDLFIQLNPVHGYDHLGIGDFLGNRWSQIDASLDVRNFFSVKGANWVKLTIIGTTYSGHPTRTTLGNTLRSLGYHMFMLHEAKVEKSQYFVVASGDDVCVWINSEHLDKYLNSMKCLTASNTDEQKKGLGQCIKEIKVSQFWDMDFCSKFCELSVGEWGIYRDGKKAWRDNLAYVGPLDQFHLRPELHLASIALSTQTELGCPILAEYYDVRLYAL